MSKYTKRAEEALQNKAEGISEHEFFGAELCRLEREANKELATVHVVTGIEGGVANVSQVTVEELFNMVRGTDRGKESEYRFFTSHEAAQAAADRHNAMSRVIVRLRGLDTDDLSSVLESLEQKQLADVAQTIDEALG